MRQCDPSVNCHFHISVFRYADRYPTMNSKPEEQSKYQLSKNTAKLRFTGKRLVRVQIGLMSFDDFLKRVKRSFSIPISES